MPPPPIQMVRCQHPERLHMVTKKKCDLMYKYYDSSIIVNLKINENNY